MKPKSLTNVVLTFLFLFAAIFTLMGPALTAWLDIAERQIIDVAFVVSIILTPAIAYFKPNWKIGLSFLVLWIALQITVAPVIIIPMSYTGDMYVANAGFPFVFFYHSYDPSYPVNEIKVPALALDILVFYLAYLVLAYVWDGYRNLSQKKIKT